MNTAGWMLTENGRQPWIVQGLMKTADGVSPSVSTTEIWISLVVFSCSMRRSAWSTLVLMLRYARRRWLRKVRTSRGETPRRCREPDAEAEPARLTY